MPGYYCFDVLYAHLQTKALAAAAASSGAPAPPAQQPPAPPFDTALECPLFVTFNKRAHPGVPWDLRGCIGNLSPLKLAKLKEYTISSSQRDRRFAPIARRTTRNTRNMFLLSSACLFLSWSLICEWTTFFFFFFCI